MSIVKVAAAVLNQTPLAWHENRDRILAAISDARQAEADVLCLPELCITGYGCEDAFHSHSVQQTAWEILHEIVPQTAGMIVALGIPLRVRNVLFNTACLITNGRILGFTAKRFLATDGIHYEQRWFKPWPAGQVAEYCSGTKSYPIGDLHYDCGGLRIGFEICEDAWVASRAGAALSRKGIDLILNPSASHFAFGKAEIRKRFVLEGSRAYAVGYVYANLLGNEAGRAIYDGGALIASGGRLLAAGSRFSFRDHEICTALIDVELNRMQQSKCSGFHPHLDRTETDCVRSEFSFPVHAPVSTPIAGAGWETSTNLKQEEFTRAVGLGLFDYLRKSHSQGFVVSLSGGADSTAVACLVALSVRMALAELGIDGFANRLPSIFHSRSTRSESDLVRRLLTTVYQSTRNSSSSTLEAARLVADGLDATHYEFDVDPLCQQYVETVSAAIGRELDWEQDDIALQNVQARVRAPGVWLLANLKHALLLSTSNRSEAAVGYATMDGDTCGGLSPIAGIDKAFLRDWLRWMEECGPVGLGPLPALAAVNSLQPTAELRPQSYAQTDEADLMPYDLLDAIERAAIRDKKDPLEVLALIKGEFDTYNDAQLVGWVSKFFQLWARNQWKRERYAPSFHLDDENLDPKTWCRFPILSGGFRHELERLTDHAN